MARDNSANLCSSTQREEPARRPIPAHPDALLCTVEAAFMLGLSPRTLEAFRLRGGGPPYVALTRKAIRYKRRDLDAWIESRRRVGTSDPGLSASSKTLP
jgi:hypothetical protein